MDKIALSIVALAQNQGQSNSFVVLLKEEEGKRQLPVVIGGFEAQAIAIAAEGVATNRPLTHDLLTNTLRSFNIELQEVIISDLKDGIFYSTLICQTLLGNLEKVDSRTSDALALAIRFGCPIFTYPGIMEEAGVVWEGQGSEEAPASAIRHKDLESLSLTQLKDQLESAIHSEDYERAANIRDELKKRK